jgi:hypothetical protein
MTSLFDVRSFAGSLWLLSLAACGDDSAGAGRDGGAPRSDAGALADAGSDSGADAGAEGPDAGDDGICGDTSSSLAPWPALPETCLPRCSAATHDAVRACPTARCATDARAADDTPIAIARTPRGDFEVGCALVLNPVACEVWQLYSCQGDFCPTEFETWTACVNGGDDCTRQRAALEDCGAASAEFQACFDERLDACFAE